MVPLLYCHQHNPCRISSDSPVLSLIAAHPAINTHMFKTNIPPSNLEHNPDFTFLLMVFWELKPHFHSYLLAEKNYIMFSTGTCLLLVCEASWQSEQENSKPNGSRICLGLVGRWRGYSWLSVSETEIICSVQCLQGHLVLSPSCALLWVTDPNFNVLLHKSTYPLERCCKIEVDSSAGTNKQMFLLNMHRETNCTHNPTGPPREIEVFIPFAPEAASTAHHWLLQMGDQFTFYSARTCCLFHSIELMSYSKAHRKR